MTSTAEEADMMMCCASCGKAEVDNVTLSKCSACKSVRYCGVTCQREHRPKHKRDCKKWAAELRDEILFRQPESSHLGDCPICYLPLSLETKKSLMMSCCSKLICCGCAYSYTIREDEERLESKCPYCRQPRALTQKQADVNMMKRAAANDPAAIREVGMRRFLEGNYVAAFEHWTKAAGFGDVDSHYQLSTMYDEGLGVLQDERKEMHHLVEAAIGGNFVARYNLGGIELKNGRMERAVKHWIITANLGFDGAIETLKKLYTKGFVSKEDFAAALRAHQAAIDETKSPQREAAETAEQCRTWINAPEQHGFPTLLGLSFRNVVHQYQA